MKLTKILIVIVYGEVINRKENETIEAWVVHTWDDIIMCTQFQQSCDAYKLPIYRHTAIDPIHAAAMTDKKRGLACRFTANLRVST